MKHFNSNTDCMKALWYNVGVFIERYRYLQLQTTKLTINTDHSNLWTLVQIHINFFYLSQGAFHDFTVYILYIHSEVFPNGNRQSTPKLVQTFTVP